MSNLYWGVCEYPKHKTARYTKFATEREAIEYARTQAEFAKIAIYNHHYSKEGELCHIVLTEGVFSKD